MQYPEGKGTCAVGYQVLCTAKQKTRSAMVALRVFAYFCLPPNAADTFV